MLRVIWFVIKGVGLLYAAFVGLTLVILAGFGVVGLQKEAPAQWADLWRGKADAEVIEAFARCEIRAPRHRQSGAPATVTDVPCERLEEELAARPKGARGSGPVRVVTIAFRTPEGRAVRTTTMPWALGLPADVAPGHRFRVSYDRADPAHAPRAPKDFVTFLLVSLGCLMIVGAALALLVRFALQAAEAKQRNRERRRARRRALEAGGPSGL